MRRGGERYVHELAASLADAGHDVSILATAPSPSRDEVRGVPVRRLRRRRFRQGRHGELADQVAFGWQSFAVLASSRIDVWHATSTADGAAAALTGRVRPTLRTVFTDHGFPAARSRRTRTDVRYHRLVVDHVDAYVCVSRPAGDRLRQDFGREPVVIPPGVDLRAFRPGEARHDHPVLLYAGSLDEPRKNVALLLAAVGQLRQRVPDLELWLYGSGDASTMIEAAPEAARAAVAVCRLAGRGELEEAYRRAWVTVLPSYAEAFGMTVVESLACGTPAVVLADSGGPAWILDGHPDAGAVAESADPTALADACERALGLATAPRTRDACRTAAEAYGWERIAAAFERVYTEGTR